jgi:hypothetical protein
MTITDEDRRKAAQIASQFRDASKAASISRYVEGFAHAEARLAETLALWRELGAMRMAFDQRAEGAD